MYPPRQRPSSYRGPAPILTNGNGHLVAGHGSLARYGDTRHHLEPGPGGILGQERWPDQGTRLIHHPHNYPAGEQRHISI